MGAGRPSEREETYHPPLPKYRFGIFGRMVTIVIIYAFIFVLTPLFLFMHIFNKLYFWLHFEKSIPPKEFFHFDRHQVKHLNFIDKLACEYCEWANGTLQWTIEVANKAEEWFCPIKNSCDPDCPKVKGWRKNFVPFDHPPKELEKFYEDLYVKLDKPK